MSGKQVTNTGTNSKGNDYTSYNDGGYSYSNKGEGKSLCLSRPPPLPCLKDLLIAASGGQTASNYYNTGGGHAFYKETSHSNSHAAQQGAPAQWHENQNQGQ